MKEKILYTCEICDTQYADKSEAIACEKNHKTNLEISKLNYLPKSFDNSGMPNKIWLRAKDGASYLYKRGEK